MFTVYHLSCDGLRDPSGISGRPLLSWRLGSDRLGAEQAWWHVLVTSVESGRCLWDSGVVRSSACAVRYAGEPLEPGEVCVWCVEAADDAGEQATSVPAAIMCGEAEEAPTSALGPLCEELLWTSSEKLNQELEHAGPEADALRARLWSQVLGVRASEHDPSCLTIAPRLEPGLRFVQGARLLDRGLLLVRWEREQASHVANKSAAEKTARVELTLAPGMHAHLELGGHARPQTLCSGHHVLCGLTLGAPC